MELKPALLSLLQSCPGATTLFITDKEGVLIVSVGEEIRARQALIASHQGTVDQTSKLVLGEHRSSIFFYEASQLVVMNISPFTVFIVGSPEANTAFLLKLREKMEPILVQLENAIPDIPRVKLCFSCLSSYARVVIYCIVFDIAWSSLFLVPTRTCILVNMMLRRYINFGRIFEQFHRRLEGYTRYFRRPGNHRWLCYSKFYNRNVRKLDTRVLLALTSAAGFSFKENGISDEKIEHSISKLDEFDKDDTGHGWEVLAHEDDFRAYRRRIDGPYEMYEYKCTGTYYDISPQSFLDSQNDIKYRREWDGNILSLDLLKQEGEHELIGWVSHYPYPLYPREYIYVRRTWVSDDKKTVVVESNSVPRDIYPSIDEKRNVRVESYRSRMAVRAHKDWDDHGLDYIFTYSDNPEANIPKYIYNWLVNQGGPYFLKQVYTAAKKMESSGRKIRSTIDAALENKLNRKRHSEEKGENRSGPEKAKHSSLPNAKECTISPAIMN